MVGRPDQGRHHPLGGVQQLPALLPDGERLRLRRPRLECRADPRRPGRRLRGVPRGRRRAPRGLARHRGRHDRPGQRAEHALLGHEARHGRQPDRWAAGRRARRPRDAAAGHHGACGRARRLRDRRRHLRDGRDGPWHVRDQLERLLAGRPGRRRAAECPHLRDRAAHHRARHRQGRGQAPVDERGRRILAHWSELRQHGPRPRDGPAGGRRPPRARAHGVGPVAARRGLRQHGARRRERGRVELGQPSDPVRLHRAGHPRDVPDLHQHEVRHPAELHALHPPR